MSDVKTHGAAHKLQLLQHAYAGVLLFVHDALKIGGAAKNTAGMTLRRHKNALISNTIETHNKKDVPFTTWGAETFK